MGSLHKRNIPRLEFNEAHGRPQVFTSCRLTHACKEQYVLLKSMLCVSDDVFSGGDMYDIVNILNTDYYTFFLLK